MKNEMKKAAEKQSLICKHIREGKDLNGLPEDIKFKMPLYEYKPNKMQILFGKHYLGIPLLILIIIGIILMIN